MTKAIKTWFKKGDYVWVINRTYGGTFVVEGKAAVLKVLGEDRALVCFDNGDKVERFIDKAAQPAPQHYVGVLNGRGRATIDDTEAMRRIYKILDGVEWTADTACEIAEVVELAGRKIREPEEDDA